MDFLSPREHLLFTPSPPPQWSPYWYLTLLPGHKHGNVWGFRKHVETHSGSLPRGMRLPCGKNNGSDLIDWQEWREAVTLGLARSGMMHTLPVLTEIEIKQLVLAPSIQPSETVNMKNLQGDSNALH